MQLDSGAQVVQLFDSWVGCLSPEDYRRYVLPHSRNAMTAALCRAPVIHFATGNPSLLPLLAEAGGTVIGVDWRIGLSQAWRMIGHDRAIQGNLDPAVLLSSRETIASNAKMYLLKLPEDPVIFLIWGMECCPRPQSTMCLNCWLSFEITLFDSSWISYEFITRPA